MKRIFWFLLDVGRVSGGMRKENKRKKEESARRYQYMIVMSKSKGERKKEMTKIQIPKGEIHWKMKKTNNMV